ncbi:hypothetical protein [Methylorubrum extorquens]|uniref:Uncharacterized protein n=1 Tax=Methylorubrum extorquens DSM 13060 TaxID=882800 RepID=H1KQ72_METEX|nr:hypothetical protein [Methylorubrum extorquens]EHP90319.1 hypothetical protein MetexDRAFT_4785 [Methylorubrum extorquens DSM 13060]
MVDEDRGLVIAYLHHSGSQNGVLPDEVAWEVYCLADGFGRREPDELASINHGWYWSHVRDSTPEAFARMAACLRGHGYGPCGPSATVRH